MSFQTLTVSKGAVVSINSELAIAVGTEIDIVNESKLYDAFIQESSSEPAASLVDKRSITQRDLKDSWLKVRSGSEEVWIYSPYGTVTLSVQVL